MPSREIKRCFLFDYRQNNLMPRPHVFQSRSGVMQRISTGRFEISAMFLATNDVTPITVYEAHRSFANIDLGDPVRVYRFNDELPWRQSPPSDPKGESNKKPCQQPKGDFMLCGHSSLGRFVKLKRCAHTMIGFRPKPSRFCSDQRALNTPWLDPTRNTFPF